MPRYAPLPGRVGIKKLFDEEGIESEIGAYQRLVPGAIAPKTLASLACDLRRRRFTHKNAGNLPAFLWVARPERRLPTQEGSVAAAAPADHTEHARRE